MLIVNYRPNAYTFMLADGKVGPFVKDVCDAFNAEKYDNFTKNENGDYELDISQSIIVHEFRLAVKNGLINKNVIAFGYEVSGSSFLLGMDKNGNLEWWPIGFCDITDAQMMKLADWA